MYNTADNSNEYFNGMAEIIAPFGRIVSIVAAPVNEYLTRTYVRVSFGKPRQSPPRLPVENQRAVDP